MKFREYRGRYETPDETVVELADRPALLAHLRKLLKPWPSAPPVQEDTVRVEPLGYRRPTEWSCLVVLADYGPIGYTDGPC